MSEKRLLVVDDEPEFGDLVARVATDLGYETRVTTNGRDFQNAFHELQPTLVVLDMVMPEMDGIELARKAAELDPDLKIMFITGFAAVALNPDNNAPKDAKILSKPFHLRDLVDQVERMLAA